MVLLSIRSTLKEDLSCTSAEMVYGTTLWLPGDFFSSQTEEDPSTMVSRLRNTMQRHNSFLLDGMEAGLHTFLLTCTRQLMCTFVAMRTLHH